MHTRAFHGSGKIISILLRERSEGEKEGREKERSGGDREKGKSKEAKKRLERKPVTVVGGVVGKRDLMGFFGRCTRVARGSVCEEGERIVRHTTRNGPVTTLVGFTLPFPFLLPSPRPRMSSMIFRHKAQ